MQLDRTYWNDRWEKQETGWDIGQASPAIMRFIKERISPGSSLLIPGCGNAHEAQALLEQGFTDITLLDIAPEAVQGLESRFAGEKRIRIVCEDFFQHKGRYDVIVEQTFFCALPPVLRADYVRKTWELLNEGGVLAGLLFDRVFERPGPPFGGSRQEYLGLFEKGFEIRQMETTPFSIPPRAGSELFIECIKREHYDIS